MKKIQLVSLLCIGLLSGCTSVLDKEDFGGITPGDVWQNEKMVEALVSDIHGNLMPEWPVSGSASDEAGNGSVGLNAILRGTATIDEKKDGPWSYDHIEKINFFLSNVENTDFEQKEQWKGQALFWRAWCYFGMVNTYGGVPLILEPQNPLDTESLFKSRNSTTECFAQILKDLDDAIAKLPAQWDAANYGRIDQCAVKAYKGRVMLTMASPLFNPQNDPAKWEAAYQANKEALEFARAQGKALYPKYGDIWYDERNEEVIMVNQFYNPDHRFHQYNIRPIQITKDGAGEDCPGNALVFAYPMKDGSSFDAGKPGAIETLWKDRDDRFYATIFYNGAVYPSADFKPGEHMWLGSTADGGNITQLLYGEANLHRIPFYRLKGLDKTLTKQTVYEATTDWVEIRFAEVLMNYGEAANELGKSDEALQVLYNIRKRAGILPGSDNHYGIKANSKETIREAYQKERFVEFAFEGKRWDDIRRWRAFDILNNQKTRYTLKYTLKEGAPLPEITQSIEDIYQNFDVKVVEDSPGYNYDVKESYYFYAIPRKHLERNSNLEQNNNWGGTFDPLK